MKKIAIPKQNRDLRKYALRRSIMPPALYVAYITFFAYAFYFYLVRRPKNLGIIPWWVHLIYALAIVVSGFVVFRLGRCLTDKNMTGRIEDYKVTRNYGRGLSRKAGTVMDFHTYIKITVINENGKKRRVTAQLFEDGYDGYYKSNGFLVKYKGLNYPICRESEEEGIHICTVCGVRTFYKEGKAIHGEAQPEIRDGLVICRSCGHTLINL